jgi:hypothetical protein
MKDWINWEGQEYVNLLVEGLERSEDIGGSRGKKNGISTVIGENFCFQNRIRRCEDYNSNQYMVVLCKSVVDIRQPVGMSTIQSEFRVVYCSC